MTTGPTQPDELFQHGSGPLWEAFVRWSRYACSPGNGHGHLVKWYWDVWQEGARATQAPLSEYLKDGETASECVERNRRDVVQSLGMLAVERRKCERLTAALQFYARHEHWMSLASEGFRVVLIAHGKAIGGDGWAEAESALTKGGEQS